ncbi:MAG: Rossmann-like and DUF2520 domain-containing protein [bacterium]
MKTIANQENIVVVGAGKVGSSIAGKLFEEGRLSRIIHRNPEAFESFYGITESYFTTSLDDIPEKPKLMILAITENNLEEIDSKIADSEIWRDCIIAHTSGINDRYLLKACRKECFRTAAVHPYQTFFSPNPLLLNDIAWGIDCDIQDFEFLADIIRILKGKPFLLDNTIPNFKGLYHSSAVVASNFTTLLLSLADEIAKSAGLDAKEFLKPIVYQTIDNFFNSELENIPLTGPIARADNTTLTHHIDSLEQFPLLKTPYIYSCMGAIETAAAMEILNDENYERLISTLKFRLNKNDSFNR